MKLHTDYDYSLREVYDEVVNENKYVIPDETKRIIQQNRESFENLKNAGTDIYGTTTGFGPLVQNESNQDATKHNQNLINHLGAGTGSSLPATVTKIAMVVRGISISRGYSGIRYETLKNYFELIHRCPAPGVPETGSVGASGDLIPMANVLLAFEGDGVFLDNESRKQHIDADSYFNSNSIDQLEFDGRDALALVNGVPFSTSFALVSTLKSKRLKKLVEKSSAWLYKSLGCRKEALSENINRLKGHESQKKTARNIRDEIQNLGDYEESESRPLQEVYSIRSVPQVLGAFQTALDQTREITRSELNGVDDNPVFCNENSDEVFHGANFVGQHLAFGLDGLNNALTQLGNLLHCQISLLLDPDTNNSVNKLLAPDPGSTSGLAGMEINATAIISEMRNDCQNRGSSSLSTNGKNQDIVPMSFEAGKVVLKQVERCFKLFSMLGVALSQYQHLSQKNLGTPEWFPEFSPMNDDRPLRNDIDRISRHLSTL